MKSLLLLLLILLLLLSTTQMFHIPPARADQQLVDQYCTDLSFYCKRCISAYDGAATASDGKALTNIVAACARDSVKEYRLMAGFIRSNVTDPLDQTTLTNCFNDLHNASALFDRLQAHLDAGEYRLALDAVTDDIMPLAGKCSQQELQQLPADSDARKLLEVLNTETSFILDVLESFINYLVEEERVRNGGSPL